MTNVRFYNGNTRIKRVGQVIEFTPEMEIEYEKCMNDPVYFARNYMKIQHVDKGLISLDLYPYQEEVIRKFQKSRKNIVLQSRQSGKTTTATAIILHYMLFNTHKLIGLLANKGDAAREILMRIQLAYENLPLWLQQGVVEWNKGSMELENGCRVIASATSGSSIRGKSCSLLYIDETAFVNDWSTFYASTYPTLASGETTQMLFTSTANGLNHFYYFWKGAVEGVNGFAHTNVTWDKVPGRDNKWKEETLAALNYDMEKFNQEFNNEFLGSSGTLINGVTLRSLRPLIPLASKDGLKMYEKPTSHHNEKGEEIKHIYVMVVDVSRGKGLDYSTFSVIDVTSLPYKQVCTYRNNLTTPTDFAGIIHNIAKYYNEAHVLVEINDIGGQVADSLHYDYEYENILYTESNGRAGKKISSGGKSAERGIRTTITVKSVGCSLLKLITEQDKLTIVDEDTISELATFSRKGKSYEAESGKHDDMVMTLVLFAWLTDQTFLTDLNDINTMAALRDRTDDDILEALSSFGIIKSEPEQTAKLERFGNEWWEPVEISSF